MTKITVRLSTGETYDGILKSRTSRGVYLTDPRFVHEGTLRQQDWPAEWFAEKDVVREEEEVTV